MKPLLSLLIILLTFNIQAQNLIPNPGFEDVNICEKYKEQCSPKAWRNILLKGFRFPELALMDSREGISPKKGLRAAIIPLFHKSRKDDRTYIQVPFLCELEKGKKYTFSFHYLLTEETTQSIGLLFSDSLGIRTNIDGLLGQTPDIEITLNDKPKFRTWKEFSVEYTAKGGEQGMIFGNYMEDQDIEYTPTVKLKKSKHYARRLTIWLDEFSLIPMDELEAPCDLEKNRKKIYDDSIRHYIKNIVMHKDIKKEIIEVEEEEPIVSHNHIGCFPKMEESEKPKQPILEKKEEIIDNKIVVNQSFVLNNINFENNSSRLLSSSYVELNRLLSALQANLEYRIEIIGHTDNIGSASDNMRLSRRRAESVAAYLIEKGISASRISSLGRGENEPAFDNATEEGRSSNRRVEFIMN